MLSSVGLFCRDPEGILACCTHIPPLVQQNLSELHAIVKNARERPIEKVFVNSFVSTLNTCDVLIDAVVNRSSGFDS